MKKVKVKIRLSHPDAKMPLYGSSESAGFDLYSVSDVEIGAGERVIVNTGVHLEIEGGYCWQYWDRSGLASKGVTFMGGLIDSDYRGEFKVILLNTGKEPYKIEKGDRIIQVVPVPIVQVEFEKVEELEESGRGEGGFGSTGRK